MLQKPHFDLSMPRIINYAGMGLIGGHEMTHAFDLKGELFVIQKLSFSRVERVIKAGNQRKQVKEIWVKASKLGMGEVSHQRQALYIFQT